MTTVFLVLQYSRLIEVQSKLKEKKLPRMNQGSNFLGSNFSIRDNVRTPIQFRRENQSQHLKRSFFLQEQTFFTSIVPVLLDWSNKTSGVSNEIQVQKPILVVATD